MSKERFLTVLIPIKDSDCYETVYNDLSALESAFPASVSNINVIYKVKDGTYYRSYFNGTAYAYHAVVDREFPYLGNPMEIYDFTYDATRMGTAPIISAQGVMRYAEKEGGEDVTLDGLWTQKCHVVFNGRNMYLKQIPTSSKSNEDARYKYDLDFVDETVVLERVYLYDVVQPYITEKPISESATFSFFGDIQALVDRINASLIRSGLSSLVRKYVPYPNAPWYTVPYLTYEQWNTIIVDPTSLVGSVFESGDELMEFYGDVYEPLNGDYNRYLMDFVYENENGVYTLHGYQCVISKDKYGNDTTSDEKLVSFEQAYIHDALQQFHDTFELQYYITRKKDQYGEFTGDILIVVGDCEHDFADVDPSTGDFIRDEEGIPTSESPFDYGVEDELLSKEKANTTEKIVSRITGVGSTDNIPWHYPNPTPDGWIKPFYTEYGVEVPNVTIDYPVDEGNTAEDYARYEKFLKNRVGIAIKRGVVKGVFFETDYNMALPAPSEDYYILVFYYQIDTHSVEIPRITLELNYNPSQSKCSRLTAALMRNGSIVALYDSSESYADPTPFQTMFDTKDGKHWTGLMSNKEYTLQVGYYIPKSEMPLSQTADYEGYLYPYVYYDQWGTLTHVRAYVGENFYDSEGLQPFLEFVPPYPTPYYTGPYDLIDSGYSINGEPSEKVSPTPRVTGKHYKDLSSGKIYACTTSAITNISTGDNKEAFAEDPIMSGNEWLNTFVNMKLRVYANDGWYINNKRVQLEDYGVSSPYQQGTGVPVDIFNAIEFQRVKWVTPQTNLMPEVFIKTDGERRYYNAKNYWNKEDETLIFGTADVAIGEEQVNSNQVRNNIFKEEETDPDDEHYEFENEYIPEMPYEHIENFDDVKPTIKEQTNTVDGNVIRIDVVEMFEYDETDNDEIWEESSDGSIQGEYKHPYFFAKLRPLGFNLFDMALQEDMVLSMTTGNCGACNFKIGVDENSKKNPVQLWEYDVYRGDYLASAELVYEKDTLRRYVNLIGLYYDTNGTQEGYKPIVDTEGILKGASPNNYSENVAMYQMYNYTAEAVKNGYVGTMKQRGALHFEGDVVTDGKFIESQQDTTENYVWVALMKDTETYGVLMPSARPDYTDPNLNQYIRPKSITDVHVTADPSQGISESTNEEDEENADKFVIINIRMPQIYLRRAEHELARKLVAYMHDNNYQKFNFSIKFSRIYIEENPTTDNDLNENAVMYVRFNRGTYRQYVKHYTYKMSHDAALPEVNVDMNEELSVTKTIAEQWDSKGKRDGKKLSSKFNSIVKQVQDRIDKTTMKKDGTVMMSGNIIVDGENTSLIEIARRGYGGSGKVLEWGEF